MTDNSQKPQIPNYIPDQGRLVLDRFDFQTHVDGTAFRHHADQIDLVPTVVIASTNSPNVQDAIQRLANLVGGLSLPPATVNSAGIVQLAGDIAGTYNSVKVVGLQGSPVSNVSPAINQVLAWNGSTWTPTSTGSFSAGGDLTGTNTNQQVVSLTGSGGTVSVLANSLNFGLGTTPTIGQTTTTSGAGAAFTLSAQTTTQTGLAGGNLTLSSGAPGFGGFPGALSLRMGASTMVQATSVVNAQRVLALVDPSNLTSADMPSGTGDMVVYVRNAAVAPTTAPANGSILYSNGGLLSVYNADGTNFPIGSINNPSTWGTTPTSGQSITYRNYGVSSANTPITVLTYPIPDHTSIRVDVIVIGKEPSAVGSAQFNMSIGYVRNGGAPVAVGTLSTTDPRYTPLFSIATNPNISISGNNLIVSTGASSLISMNWTVITQIVLVQ